MREELRLLKVGISGVRGIVGQTLTPELIVNFASAFGTFVGGGTVLVGRDPRLSSPMVHAAACSALLSTGCTVLDLGICPTPVLQHAVRQGDFRGGVSISAGHNDAQWNALIFINQEGLYLNPHEGEEMLDIYHAGHFSWRAWDGLGQSPQAADFTERYLDALCALVDAEAVRRAGFRVIIDPCNGAGSVLIDRFAERLGFSLIPINNEPSGIFPHDPEPRPRNARQIASIIKPVQGDIGFVLNSDVSRVSIVSEVGETVTEEYTFPLTADYILDRSPGTVVTNVSTTRTLDEVVRRHNGRLVKTPIGQAYCISAMLDEEAVLAGEGSGGVALAAFQPAFDGFACMATLLERMATTNVKASEMVEALPRYHIVKEKIYCPSNRVYSAVDAVRRHYPAHDVDMTDGVRIDFPDGWVHIRASDTEPLIRIIGEAQTKERARERVDQATALIEGTI